jgi:cyanophycinase
MRRLVVLVVVVWAAAGVATVGDAPRGHLVLNGGGEKPRDVMEKFVELSGGPDAPIVVFPTASELQDTGDYYRTLLHDDYGCTNVAVAEVYTPQDGQDETIAARVEAAGGIFFAGGDQRRIARALGGTRVGVAVRTAFDRGAVVGGTSAGTACQSGLMITGDGDFEVIAAGAVELWPGLGLFEGVIVDQHFVSRRRHNRLLSVVLEHPELLGVGVDDATAVWVRPDGTFQVLGEGWVVVYDARSATVNRGAGRGDGAALGVHGMVTHVLLPGEVFDVTRGVVAALEPDVTR